MIITSVYNQQVKAWKKLKTRKFRKYTGSFIAEGYHLVEEAFRSDWEIKTLLIREDVMLPEWAANLPAVRLAVHVFNEITEAVTPQGIAAIVKKHEQQMQKTGLTLLTDRIQDPGNLGTIIRTADALGFSQVILGQGTVDAYNEKVVRASQGSIFHLPVIETALEKAIAFLKKHSFTVWASTLKEAVTLEEAKFNGNTALIIGNEGEGISPIVLNAADRSLKVPIIGKAESLNAAVAAGIMMYAMSKEIV